MRSIRLRRRPDEAPPAIESEDTGAAAGRERPALARRMRAAAHPRFYAAQVGDPSLADDVDAAVRHYLEHGQQAGARLSGLFNEGVYLERLAERGLGVAAGETPFVHWLTVGWDERVVPTVLFDEAFYVARHPDLAQGPEWGFAQYLRAGCYAPGRSPTPFGPNYGGVPDRDARERQDPPLVAGLLHRAAEFDLSRTSWLEEGVQRGAAKLAGLDTERMRTLVAKAAAIEPLVAQTPKERWVSWPPHTHPMVRPTAAAEQVRRSVGLVRADTMVVVPGGAEPGPGVRAVVAALRTQEPDATVLVVTTDAPAPALLAGATRTVDLSGPFAGMTDARRLLGLLDLVRGLRPRRVVVADSALGWRLLTSYATTLRHETSLVAVLREATEEDGAASVAGDFQACFDRLDRVVTDTDAQRDDLVARYLLTSAARCRLVSAAEVGAHGLDALAGGGGARA
ncbi:hypothetical protein [Nocardioides stalactiti]|uniref:hypothetical protein n=1 Tax=Nocardioides stalactiti TaxID=2755356 RepID=UPI0016042847|nr:hypothetical protein [Nocardioides stalactiti]